MRQAPGAGRALSLAELQGARAQDSHRRASRHSSAAFINTKWKKYIYANTAPSFPSGSTMPTFVWAHPAILPGPQALKARAQLLEVGSELLSSTPLRGKAACDSNGDKGKPSRIVQSPKASRRWEACLHSPSHLRAPKVADGNPGTAWGQFVQRAPGHESHKGLYERQVSEGQAEGPGPPAPT